MDLDFIKMLLWGALIFWTVSNIGQKKDHRDEDSDVNPTVIDANDLWHRKHDDDNNYGGDDGGDSGGSDGSDSND